MLSSGTSTTASPLPAPPKPTGSVGRNQYCCLPPPPPPFYHANSDGSSDTHPKPPDLPNRRGGQPKFPRKREMVLRAHGEGVVVGAALVEGVGVVMHARLRALGAGVRAGVGRRGERERRRRCGAAWFGLGSRPVQAVSPPFSAPRLLFLRALLFT